VLLLFLKGGSRTGPSPHDGGGELHLAFAIRETELARWEAWLTEDGIAVEEKRAWEVGGHSLYFRDPDRHLLEVATPGFGRFINRLRGSGRGREGFREVGEDAGEQGHGLPDQDRLNWRGESPPGGEAVDGVDGGVVVADGIQLGIGRPLALDGLGEGVEGASERDQIGAAHLFDGIAGVARQRFG
jgi:hypothetical protein